MDSFACREIIGTLHASLAHRTRNSIDAAGRRRAGVLVPLVSAQGECELVFTQRTEDVETHKGQISFPGGAMDPADRDEIETAVRETEEELGVPRGAVETIGMLDDLATPTGFVITPVVGVLAPDVAFVANPHEVADVFRLPLAFFADPRNGRTELRDREGKPYEVWFYADGTHVIWGATAAIIRALLKELAIV